MFLAWLPNIPFEVQLVLKYCICLCLFIFNLPTVSLIPGVVHENPRIGSDGESEDISGTSDEKDEISPVKLRGRPRYNEVSSIFFFSVKYRYNKNGTSKMHVCTILYMQKDLQLLIIVMSSKSSHWLLLFTFFFMVLVYLEYMDGWLWSEWIDIPSSIVILSKVVSLEHVYFSIFICFQDLLKAVSRNNLKRFLSIALFTIVSTYSSAVMLVSP